MSAPASVPATVRLADFARRVHSHAGEDGIIEQIFARLGVSAGYFVEFGAWDGLQLSNTRLLISRGWSGLLIEGDAEKFQALSQNVRHPGVTLRHRTVGLTGTDSLDAILAEAGAPPHLDLLSIDIDSDDLAVWRSLQNHRATCVIIEFNVTIPFDTEFENPPGRNWGNSALSIVRYATTAGYALVAITGMNLIFLDAGLGQRAGILPVTLVEAAAGMRWFWGYDGSLLCRQPGRAEVFSEVMTVPWHAYRMAQPMPRALRRWRLGHQPRRWERMFSLLTILMTRPPTFLRLVLRRWKGRP